MVGPRLPAMLKDAGLTTLVAAALGFFIVGFRTVDVGSRTGLSFDYEFIDLAVAVSEQVQAVTSLLRFPTGAVVVLGGGLGRGDQLVDLCLGGRPDVHRPTVASRVAVTQRI